MRRCIADSKGTKLTIWNNRTGQQKALGRAFLRPASNQATDERLARDVSIGARTFPGSGLIYDISALGWGGPSFARSLSIRRTTWLEPNERKLRKNSLDAVGCDVAWALPLLSSIPLDSYIKFLFRQMWGKEKKESELINHRNARSTLLCELRGLF
ncbi:hypothetical protein NE237_000090 [Protea cynaroides]|uniref:Uncharacterized protein n=1 Tax=Protea cynaroides TaxID=273540 RepID=A0A9Q0JRY5_9MAGN|nr:hypothetical protein NE237_000090 [Protea cynaroides]